LKTKGAGECQFRALVSQIDHDTYDHTDLRRDIVKYISDNWHTYGEVSELLHVIKCGLRI